MLSDFWESPSPLSNTDALSEFKATIEVYLTNAALSGLRKAPPQRKKSTADRRDSTQASSLKSGNEDAHKRLKGQSSWMGLGRGSVAAGQWKSASCTLSEVGTGCKLRISIDQALGYYQTVYISTLKNTDVRLADASLFCYKKYCIVIYCQEEQRETQSSPTTEPLYLKFDCAETCNTWLSLLRAYTTQEIYGRNEAPIEGGVYRIWREVNLKVTEARNLGTPKLLTDPGSGTKELEVDAVDMDVACEVYFNERLCGRTTVYKSVGAPEWHEEFVFTDLPPFGILNVKVMNEKKSSKPVFLGEVRIALGNFRRGEAVDGWFPILENGPIASSVQVGDLRMKIRVDEEIVLPMSCYSRLLQTINSRNCLEWIRIFDQKLHLKTASKSLIWLAMANDTLIKDIQEIADREVDFTPHSHTMMFRGNTVFTKVMEQCMGVYGKAFLEASVGTVLRRIFQEKVTIEIDPNRLNKGPKELDKNVDLLIFWCGEFWGQIFAVKDDCPSEMKQLLQHVRKLVASKYQVVESTEGKTRILPWQSVSAFCFLRFIAPAMLNPHLFGLCAGRPPLPVQRSLTLITKVIQSLANLNTMVGKEDYMRLVAPFLKEKLPEMKIYLSVVSTNDSSPAPTPNHRGRKDIVDTFRLHLRAKPALVREAVPLLPYLVDIPAQVAAVAAAVTRGARGDHYLRSSDPADEELNELLARSGEVEATALQRVGQLASRSSEPYPTSPSSKRLSAAPTITPRFRKISVSKPPPPSIRPRRTSRPFTAPSQSDLSDIQGPESPSDVSLPSSPVSLSPLAKLIKRASQVDLTGGQPSSPEDASWLRRADMLNARSPSVDSVPGSSQSRADFSPRAAESQNESDDQGRRKKGILKSILRRP